MTASKAPAQTDLSSGAPSDGSSRSDDRVKRAAAGSAGTARRGATMIGVSALCLALAACGSTPEKPKPKFPASKYGVAASPRVVKDGPVPKGGGRQMVGKPYKVAGKWYHPKHDPDYTSVGYASWYGPTFHGRMTANGEVFDRNALTAAHTTMPLPSYARVTNLKNGRSMIVRVNDRGPFHDKRTIDLSERVAEMLDMKHKGVGKVKVEYVGPARLDGQDEAFLLASYRGPGAVEPGATMPGTLLAQATPPVQSGPAPVPAARPYDVLLASSAGVTVVAFDPAEAFEAGGATVQVAALGGGFQPAPAAVPAAQAATPVDAPALGYGSGQPTVLFQPQGELAPRPAGTLGRIEPGSAISSWQASARIEAAYAAFDGLGGGTRLADLAARVRESR